MIYFCSLFDVLLCWESDEKLKQNMPRFVSDFSAFSKVLSRSKTFYRNQHHFSSSLSALDIKKKSQPEIINKSFLCYLLFLCKSGNWKKSEWRQLETVLIVLKRRKHRSHSPIVSQHKLLEVSQTDFIKKCVGKS